MLTEEGRKTALECEDRSKTSRPGDCVPPVPANEVSPVNVRQGPVRTERAKNSRARPKSNPKATTLDVNKVSIKTISSSIYF